MILHDGKNEIELLAPAGGMRALCAAVQNGADAVYLGADRFSARANAENFDDDGLADAVKYCRQRGVRTYLTLNTLILADEMEGALSLAHYAAAIGMDGIILQDIGLAQAIKKYVPSMPLHASTQMSVHSLEGVKFLERYGFSRVVLARELSYDEIKYISENSKAEIEVFVHGALCVCYSGKCLMSSMIGGRSGNRGSCAQPCRLPCKIGGSEGYHMSTYDLSLADEVEKLRACGVKSLKIEGRMKSGEYVAVVTDAFRRIIDTGKITDYEKTRLRDIFCRGGKFTKGYFEGNTGAGMINSRISNDAVSKNAPHDLLKSAENSFREGLENSKIPVEITICGGDRVKLFMSACGKEVTVSADAEDTEPIYEERLLTQLKKLGQTPLYPAKVNIEGECRMKISAVNSMRREAAEKLLCLLSEPSVTDKPKYKAPHYALSKESPVVSVSVTNEEQLKAALLSDAEILFVPIHLLGSKKLGEFGKKIYAVLPTIIRRGELSGVLQMLDKAIKGGACGIVLDSYDALYEALKYKMPVIIGNGFGISNLEALEFFKNAGAEMAFLSPELTMGEVEYLASNSPIPTCVQLYGRHRVMITENCLIRAANGKCSCGSVLTDRKGAQFPIICDEASHRNIIYNFRPTVLKSRAKLDAAGVSLYNIALTAETYEESVRTLEKKL